MTLVKFRIAHISDPHFGTTDPAKIRALTDSIREQSPTMIAISGDITQRARRSQFEEARNFCAGLHPTPIIAIPGNHDIPLYNFPARFLVPYMGFKHNFGFPTMSHQQFGEVEIFGINSTSPIRAVQGEVGPQHIRGLQKFKRESLVRVAVFHHPMDCRQLTDEKNLLTNASEVLPHFEAAKVDLVLSGHIHDPFVRLSDARYPQARRPMIISIAGTCLSSRTRSGAPNSFCIVDIETHGDGAEIAIKRFDLNSTDPADMMFAPITEVRFTRTGRDEWRET